MTAPNFEWLMFKPHPKARFAAHERAVLTLPNGRTVSVTNGGWDDDPDRPWELMEMDEGGECFEGLTTEGVTERLRAVAAQPDLQKPTSSK